MKLKLTYFIIPLFLLISIFSFSQAFVTFSTKIGTDIHIEESFKDVSLKKEITNHILSNQTFNLIKTESKNYLSLGFENAYYTIKKYPENLILYKIENSRPNKTGQLITELIAKLAYANKIKFLSLKNESYKFSFRLRPVLYDSYSEEVGGFKEVLNDNQTLNFKTYSDSVVLEVTNLSDQPIYFSILEINTRGVLNAFVPNRNCELIGDERRINPNKSYTFKNCIFQFGPPYEKITLKGFASREPINFQPLINDEDKNSINFLKDSFNEMYTSEFTFNIVNEKGKMINDEVIIEYKTKTSPELETVLLELKSIEKNNGNLNKDYINKLNEVITLNTKLGNIDEVKFYKDQLEKLIKEQRRLIIIEEFKLKNKAKLKVNEYLVSLRKLEKNLKIKTTKEQISFLKAEYLKKVSRIIKLEKEILKLNKKLENQKSSNSSKREMRGTITKNSEKELLTKFTYKALIIAVEDYNDENINDLKFPISDAKKLKTILQENYAFEESNIKFLKNPSRKGILEALHYLYKNSSDNEHLLIFYAGHGVYDKDFKRGYWLPSDAEYDNRSNWISNPDIKDYISNIKSKHTILISDACFSGSIFQFNRDLTEAPSKIVKKLLEKNARNAMTSGLDKTVPDESVFIKYLLKSLSENKSTYLKSSDLFKSIREAVISNTDNNPQFGVIQNANHEGGEFMFLKRE